MGHIFISYSHHDRDYVHQLADALRTNGFQVWVDDRIDYGSHWPAEIQEQLDTCGAFVVVLTQNSYNSEWVQNELSRAKRKGKPIFPLLLEGELWLSIETTQYDNVRGGRMPETKFLDAVRAAIARADAQAPAMVESKNEKQATSGSVDSMIWRAESTSAESAGSAKSSRRRMGLIIGGVVLLIAIAAAAFFLRPSGGSPVPTATPAPENTATVLPSATPQPTEAATATTVATDTATPPPTVGAPVYFTDEFNGDLSHYTLFEYHGKEQQADVHTLGGSAVFDLNHQNLWTYLTYNDQTYTDATISIIARNEAQNKNNVTLVCRFSDVDQSWYEFNVSNGGEYWIYAHLNGNYTILAEGGSRLVKPGQATNTYKASCQGDQLSLSINDQLVKTVSDNSNNLQTGKVGFGVSSFDVFPIKVAIASFTVDK